MIKVNLKNITLLYSLIFLIVSVVYFATITHPAYASSPLTSLTNINQNQWMYFVTIFQLMLIGFVLLLLLAKRFIGARRAMIFLGYLMFILAVIGFIGLFASGVYVYVNNSSKTTEFQVMFGLFMGFTALALINVFFK